MNHFTISLDEHTTAASLRADILTGLHYLLADHLANLRALYIAHGTDALEQEADTSHGYGYAITRGELVIAPYVYGLDTATPHFLLSCAQDAADFAHDWEETEEAQALQDFFIGQGYSENRAQELARAKKWKRRPWKLDQLTGCKLKDYMRDRLDTIIPAILANH